MRFPGIDSSPWLEQKAARFQTRWRHIHRSDRERLVPETQSKWRLLSNRPRSAHGQGAQAAAEPYRLSLRFEEMVSHPEAVDKHRAKTLARAQCQRRTPIHLRLTRDFWFELHFCAKAHSLRPFVSSSDRPIIIAIHLVINSRSAALAYVRAPVRRRTSAALPAWSIWLIVVKVQMMTACDILTRELFLGSVCASFDWSADCHKKSWLSSRICIETMLVESSGASATSVLST